MSGPVDDTAGEYGARPSPGGLNGSAADDYRVPDSDDDGFRGPSESDDGAGIRDDPMHMGDFGWRHSHSHHHHPANVDVGVIPIADPLPNERSPHLSTR